MKKGILTCIKIFALAVVLGGTSVYASGKDSEWGKVKDIHFGEVLYEFYKQNYFSALARVMSAQKTGRIRYHELHGNLLLGGMMVSYGMHDKASKLFDDMASQQVPDSIHDRMWFYTGKIRYQRGYDTAMQAFAKIKRPLPDEMEDERYLLQANIMMQRGQPEKAIDYLNRMPGNTVWEGYGRYNLGVALVKSGERDQGISLLAKIGEIKTNDREMQALKDKANLALGYAYLQIQSSPDARRYLEKVRLTGPLSNKALLGIGWAYSAMGEYDRALVYWDELHKRNVIDAAVQESLLAVPYALAKAQAYRQAKKKYREAEVIFETEIERLRYAIQAIRSGKLIEQLVELDPRMETGWFWALNDLPEAPESRYLVNLLARHDFQEALKNYRDTRFLAQNIQRWRRDLKIFDDVLTVRRESYQRRLPRIRSRNAKLDSKTLMQRRNRLADEIGRIERQRDTTALATRQELNQLAQLSKYRKRLYQLEKKYGKKAVTEAATKIRLSRGVLIWQMDSDYAPRLWELKKSLKQVDKALEQSRSAKKIIKKVQTSVPMMFVSYERKAHTLRNRLGGIDDRARKLESALARRIEDFAIAGLEQQQQRLDTYLTQARYGSTQLIDKAAHP